MEQQASDSQAATPDHGQPAVAGQRTPPRQLPPSDQPATATDDLVRATRGSKQQASQATAQGDAAAKLDTAANRAKHDHGRTTKRDTGGADDRASMAVPVSGRDDPPAASEQQFPGPGYAMRQDGTSQREARAADGMKNVAGAASSRSIDGDDDGMLDRFGSVDIITGKPVRDLKLDPVLQLVKWRESLFGSRDSVSESLDKDDDGSA